MALYSLLSRLSLGAGPVRGEQSVCEPLQQCRSRPRERGCPGGAPPAGAVRFGHRQELSTGGATTYAAMLITKRPQAQLFSVWGLHAIMERAYAEYLCRRINVSRAARFGLQSDGPVGNGAL